MFLSVAIVKNLKCPQIWIEVIAQGRIVTALKFFRSEPLLRQTDRHLFCDQLGILLTFPVANESETRDTLCFAGKRFGKKATVGAGMTSFCTFTMLPEVVLKKTDSRMSLSMKSLTMLDLFAKSGVSPVQIKKSKASVWFLLPKILMEPFGSCCTY